MADNTLRKYERLNGKTRIGRLFTGGNSFIVYPYRIVYSFSESTALSSASILVSVPKRNFKRAVKRNLIRRRIKECYRLQKHPLLDRLAAVSRKADIAFLYIGKEVWEYAALERKMGDAIGRLQEAAAATGLSPDGGKTEGISGT